VWETVRPAKIPRASGSATGVRSPAKYRQPGASRGLLVNRPGHLGGPVQRGHLELRGDPPHPRGIPVAGMGVVERRGLARRLVVEEISPGQAVRQPAAGHEESAGAGEHLRLLLGDPREFGTHGLGGQNGAAASQHLGTTQLGVQRVDLRRGSGVAPYRMAGRKGVMCSSVTSTQGPMPLTPTASTCPGAAATSSARMATHSSHQIRASISTHPGWGLDTSCERMA